MGTSCVRKESAAIDVSLKCSQGGIKLYASPLNPHLTKRELEILKWVVQGYTAKRIGLLLKISNRTVEKNIENLIVTLDLS